MTSHVSTNLQPGQQGRQPFPEQQGDQQHLQQQYAEAALQDNEWLFHTVWEYASDAIALSTPDGTVTAANPAYFHLYGYTPEEVLGKNYALIFPEEQRAWAQELYHYLYHSPTISPSVAVPVRRADGTERFVESRYVFLPDQHHRLAMLSIIRDITEQKRAEEALWVCEEKLRVALDVGRMVSWEWDIESDTIRLSAHLQAALGLLQDHCGPRDTIFRELVHPQDRALVEQEMTRALEEGTDTEFEFRAVLQDGTQRWKTYGQVLANEAGKPMRMVCISTSMT